MTYLPAVESMEPLDSGPLGDTHVGVLFGNIKAAGRIQYAYLFVIYKKEETAPVFIVSSEVNSMHKRTGGGSHFLGIFQDSGRANLGDADDWADAEKFFQKALQVVEQHLNLRPSSA